MLRQSLNYQIKDSVYPFHLTRCDNIVNRVMDHINTLP